MEVRHCPQCGADSIDKTTSSFEYGGSTRWSCEECDWHYKRGRGIGTGTGNAGTHPRELEPGAQRQLTDVGVYCSTCETVIAGDHSCTAAEIVEEQDAPVEQAAVVEQLEEFHTSGQRVLREAVSNGEVALTPTFYQVAPWPDDEEPAMMDALRDEIERVISDKPDDPAGTYNRGDRAKQSEIKDRMAAESPVESEFLSYCFRWLERHDSLVVTPTGMYFRDDSQRD